MTRLCQLLWCDVFLQLVQGGTVHLQRFLQLALSHEGIAQQAAHTRPSLGTRPKRLEQAVQVTGGLIQQLAARHQPLIDLKGRVNLVG